MTAEGKMLRLPLVIHGTSREGGIEALVARISGEYPLHGYSFQP